LFRARFEARDATRERTFRPKKVCGVERQDGSVGRGE
jgi:hypothetical protein